ncbi:MAG: hypothetical protein RR293_03630 [Bacteroidales bacterium]
MKRLNIILLFASFMCLITGCIGNKGNTLESYDVGTLLNVNGKLCIKGDNVKLFLTGAGLPEFTENSITRCFCTFMIDWDDQPEDAYAIGVYNAKINVESKWETENYLPNIGLPFTGSDSLINISKPYIVNVLNTPIITFQTSTYFSDSPVYQLAVDNVDIAKKVVMIDFVYSAGQNVNKDIKTIQWRSYKLPAFTQDYTLVFQFKSFTKPAFTHTIYSDPIDIKKNAYRFNINYKATAK